MTLNVYAQTDIGRQRETNEDAVAAKVFEETYLLIVADGMGGHAAGDVASDCATTEIEAYVSTAITDGRTDYEQILDEAITVANEEINKLAAADSTRSGMGTTVVAALVSNDQATIANVGDSRAYHLGEDIEQVTVDQSLVQELVDQGEITPDEAKSHPQRNVISQALGTNETVTPDFYHQSVRNALLLCSDGLTEEVDDDVIGEIIADSSDLETTADRLINQANTNGGSDNISVLLYSSS